MKNSPIITISRQYGSGGREIGKKLAERLGVPFYDKELITLAAKESGYDEKMFENADEQASNSFLYSLSMGSGGTAGRCEFHSNMPLNDRVYIIQAKLIRELANKGPCIVVGRCADYVLNERPDVVNIFIHADLPSRVARAVREYGLSSNKAEAAVLKTDKRRATYHDYYTDSRWGVSENYHLCVNSNAVGVEGTVDVVEAFVQRWRENAR